MLKIGNDYYTNLKDFLSEKLKNNFTFEYKNISLQVGLEPTTEWLTATRSTAELLKKKLSVYNNLLLSVLNLNEMEN
jgi:hypothetical protein